MAVLSEVAVMSVHLPATTFSLCICDRRQRRRDRHRDSHRLKPRYVLSLAAMITDAGPH